MNWRRMSPSWPKRVCLFTPQSVIIWPICKLVHLLLCILLYLAVINWPFRKQFRYFEFRSLPLPPSHYHLICLLSLSFHPSLLLPISPHKHSDPLFPPPLISAAVWLVQCLQSGDQDVLLKALKKPPECSLKREGLRAVSALLIDPRGKVCSSASSLLRSLAEQPRHRERVRWGEWAVFALNLKSC